MSYLGRTLGNAIIAWDLKQRRLNSSYELSRRFIIPCGI